MHFVGQAQLFFPFLLLLLLEIIISVYGFPFLQEIGADSQHSMLISSSQNLDNEKQPILLSSDKGPLPVQKEEEKFQSEKNAERIELESAEDASDGQPVDLNEVISQIKNVESFHEQLELEREHNNEGRGEGEKETTMIGQIEGIETIQLLNTTANPKSITTTEFTTMKDEEEKASLNDATSQQKVQPTKMATLLLFTGDVNKEKEKVFVENSGNSSDFGTLKGEDKDELKENEEEKNGTKMSEPINSATESEIGSVSANKFIPIQEIGDALPPVDRILGETIEEEEEKGEELTIWDKIIIGLRCARQDCSDAMDYENEEEQKRLIKGWKITRRARQSTSLNGIGHNSRKFVCPCKNAILF